MTQIHSLPRNNEIIDRNTHRVRCKVCNKSQLLRNMPRHWRRHIEKNDVLENRPCADYVIQQYGQYDFTEVCYMDNG